MIENCIVGIDIFESDCSVLRGKLGWGSIDWIVRQCVGTLEILLVMSEMRALTICYYVTV